MVQSLSVGKDLISIFTFDILSGLFLCSLWEEEVCIHLEGHPGMETIEGVALL